MSRSQPQAPRYSFSAPAELSRAGASAPETMRVNEISLHGCYLDEATSFSRGTQVTLKIYSNEQTFEATASILYSQPTLGTGLAFREVKPHAMAILRDWLQQALEQLNAPPPSIDGADSENDL